MNKHSIMRKITTIFMVLILICCGNPFVCKKNKKAIKKMLSEIQFQYKSFIFENRLIVTATALHFDERALKSKFNSGGNRAHFDIYFEEMNFLSSGVQDYGTDYYQYPVQCQAPYLRDKRANQSLISANDIICFEIESKLINPQSELDFTVTVYGNLKDCQEGGFIFTGFRRRVSPRKRLHLLWDNVEYQSENID